MSRSWFLTIHPEEEDTVLEPEPWDCVRYAVWQKERGKKSGRIHFHLYVELHRAQRFQRVQKWIGYPTANCKKKWGTRDQARNYCMKEKTRVDGPWEIGSWEAGGQGARTDLAKAVEMIKDGADEIAIIEQCPIVFVKYHRGLDRVRAAYAKRAAMRFREVEVHVRYGVAGTGKTRFVWESFDYQGVYATPLGGGMWFDNYDGEGVLLIDDFYGEKYSYADFLRLTDGYPIQIPVKGGYRWAQYTKVFITSNKHPIEWYPEGMTDALERRITSITKL